jgi:integrase
MAEDGSTARRVRVERNIYRRPSGVYEVGFKDGRGKQRWRTVVGGITAARALRDELLARRGRGERVVSDGRLRFADAAAKWLAGPVLDLRARTQECYRNALEQHLLSAIGTQRLDAISPDDLALLVRELRSRGFSESTIVIVLGVTNRVYRYAARRLGWAGTNPVSLMLPSERPKPSQGKRRRIFEGREVEQTIRAAREPYRTLFTVAALTGARLSELLALTWADARLDDLEDADDQGRSVPVAQGELPSMHSFRHTVASRALLAGESVDEIASLLGHRDANVTRAVYVRELADNRRRSMRRSRMLAEYGDLLNQ